MFPELCQDSLYGPQRSPDVHVYYCWQTNSDTGQKYSHYNILVHATDEQVAIDKESILWLPVSAESFTSVEHVLDVHDRHTQIALHRSLQDIRPAWAIEKPKHEHIEAASTAKEAQKDDKEEPHTGTASITVPAEQQNNTEAEADAHNISTAEEAQKDDEEEQQAGTPTMAEAVVEKEGALTSNVTSTGKEEQKDDKEEQQTGTASITAEEQNNAKAEADAHNTISAAEEAQKVMRKSNKHAHQPWQKQLWRRRGY